MFRWKDAPISHALASFITWTGYLSGQVPPEVHEHLNYALLPAVLSVQTWTRKKQPACVWSRLSELAQHDPAMPANLVSDFRRVQADEERHRKVFEILAGGFRRQATSLRRVKSEDSLTRKIGKVSEFFLARRQRGITARIIRSAQGESLGR